MWFKCLLVTTAVGAMPLMVRAGLPQDPPIQIQLKCQILEKPAMNGPKVVVSHQKPVDANLKETKVIARPKMLTLEGHETTMAISLDGNVQRQLRLQPKRLANGKFELAMDIQTFAKKDWRTDLKAKPALNTNEWVAVNLAGAPGAKKSYLVLIQLVPLSEDEIP